MSGERLKLFREWFELEKDAFKHAYEFLKRTEKPSVPLPAPPSTCVFMLKRTPLPPLYVWPVPLQVDAGPSVLIISRSRDGDKGYLKVYGVDPRIAFPDKYANHLTPEEVFYLAAVELMNEDVDVASCYDGELRQVMRALLDEAKSIVRRWWEKWRE